MHKALNTVLAQLPDDTKIYVSLELPALVLIRVRVSCEASTDTFRAAGPRVHKTERRVCRKGRAEQPGRQGPRGLLCEEHRDPRKIHDRRREEAQCLYAGAARGCQECDGQGRTRGRHGCAEGVEEQVIDMPTNMAILASVMYP